MGAGHDGAAAELAVRLQSAGYRVRTADFLECFPWRLGRLMRWVYTVQLKAAPWAYEATFRVWYLTPLLGRALEVVLTVLTGRRLRQLLRSEPGLACVVSTYPLSSLVLGRGRRRGWVGAPVATFVTDFGVHPLWMHPAVDLTMCVHRSSAEVAARATARSVVTTGPMVSAAFRRAPITKLAARQALGLPQEAKIALAVSGSWGVGDLESTFDALLHTDDWLPVAVCGRNDDLRARLASRGGGVVLGWTDRMPELMAAADVLVQNAGGLSCMEAFAVGLPVVTFHPIPGHGRENASAMETAGVTATARDPRRLAEVLDRAVTVDRHALVAAGRALFVGDPAGEVVSLATPSAPADQPAARRHRRPRRRRIAACGLGLAVAYGGLNLAADAATAHGVDTAHAERGTADVYVAVRVGPAALASPDLAPVLAADGVTAVVDGRTAAADPAGVRRLVRAAVDVATGGWQAPQRFHWESASDGLLRSTRALRLAAGRNCREYAPISGVSGVDLASALMGHVRIVRGSRLVALGGPVRLRPLRVYILRGDRADAGTLERALNELVMGADRAGLVVEPLSDLR